MTSENENADYRVILNALPLPVLVVDEDVRIFKYNKAAAPLLGENPDIVLSSRAGDILNCVHSKDVNEGCGRGPHCKDCVIRNSVRASFGGQNVSRKTSKMHLNRNGSIVDINLLVTTAPFTMGSKMYSLLILEDISELLEVRNLLPVCAWCKKIRDDQDYWSHIEEYFHKRLDFNFSHGMCPECAKIHFPQYKLDPGTASK